jgi:hypothetical protein
MSEVTIQDMRNEASDGAEAMFYGVKTSKFITLSVLTWGLYTLYWFYENFSRCKKQLDDDSIPLARAIFSPIFSYALFIVVNMRLEERGHKKLLSAGVIAAAYFFLNLGSKFLPDIYAVLCSLMIVVPLLGANKQINLLNLEDNSNYLPDSKYTWINWIFIVLGSVFSLLVVLGLTVMLGNA